MQTKLGSFVETVANVAVGMMVSMLLNATLLPAMGIQITLSQNMVITIIFTVTSIIRSYLFRRAFNRLSERFKF